MTQGTLGREPPNPSPVRTCLPDGRESGGAAITRVVVRRESPVEARGAAAGVVVVVIVVVNAVGANPLRADLNPQTDGDAVDTIAP